jgi:hypothetical protein
MRPQTEKLIQRIRAGEIRRADLVIYEANARQKRNDQDAIFLLEAIAQARPKDLYYVFMGFCPNADMNNRRDIEWRKQGRCTMEKWDGWSARQLADYESIKVGDLIVLKKRQKIGVSMRLFGYGRVTGINYEPGADFLDRYLEVAWSNQSAVIEVPLLGCNATINLLDVDDVNRRMPAEFIDWLGVEA